MSVDFCRRVGWFLFGEELYPDNMTFPRRLCVSVFLSVAFPIEFTIVLLKHIYSMFCREDDRALDEYIVQMYPAIYMVIISLIFVVIVGFYMEIIWKIALFIGFNTLLGLLMY